MLGQSCDSEGVVWAVKKGMSTTAPLCFGLQALAFWEYSFQVQVSMSHIAGEENWLADALSRWKDSSKGKHLEHLSAENERFADVTLMMGPVANAHP